MLSFLWLDEYGVDAGTGGGVVIGNELLFFACMDARCSRDERCA